MFGALRAGCTLVFDSMRKFVHLVEDVVQGLTIACPITSQRRKERREEEANVPKEEMQQWCN